MKRWLYFGLAALLLPALVACKGKGQQVGIAWQDGDVVAVAFLGYYDSFGDFEHSPSYPRLVKAFPQIVEAAQVEAGLGREIYLVVPRDPAATLAVNQAGASVTDADREVFYRSEEGKPVLVYNNWYETNSQIVCTDNEGRSVSFSPALDRPSGRLAGASKPGVRDISLPFPEPMEGYTSFNYADVFEGRDLGIGVCLEAGRPVLTVHAEPLEEIGFAAEEFALAEGRNEFSGINGLCKGVFLGTYGQDYNPVVYVVMENGDLKKCTVFYSVLHGGPELSEPLPDFKDVVGFERVVADGESVCALDARGDRKEVPQFSEYGLFLAQDGEDALEAELTPDWSFVLSRYNPDGSLEEYFTGSFANMERGDGLDRFRFVVNRSLHRVEDFVVDERVRKGRFSAREVGLSYEVTLSGADFFKSGTEFRDSRLVGAEENIEYD